MTNVNLGSPTKPKILVAGASGRTGAAVVAQLREKDWPVRAIVRAKDVRSDRLERLGAEIVVADLFDIAATEAAMAGTRRAYFCPPFAPFMTEMAVAFAVAARNARLESVVLLSQWLASPSHPSMLTRQHRLVDTLFSGLPDTALTIVNPGYFADNYLRLTPFAAHLGVLPSLVGDSRNAPPANEDIARVVVAALIDPDCHAGRTYRPTGPALLSTADMAAILGRVLARKVRRFEMPMWLFVKAARMQGVSAWELANLDLYNEDHRQGAFAHGAPRSDVEDVTGSPAETFEVTARRYAALPDARRGFGASAKALADFMRTPLSPGYDLARHRRRQAYPVLATPCFAMQDASWIENHGRTPGSESSSNVGGQIGLDLSRLVGGAA